MTLNRLRNLFSFLCEATFLPERKDSRQFVADANPHSSAGRAHKRVPAYKTHAATLHPELFSALAGLRHDAAAVLLSHLRSSSFLPRYLQRKVMCCWSQFKSSFCLCLIRSFSVKLTLLKIVESPTDQAGNDSEFWFSLEELKHEIFDFVLMFHPGEHEFDSFCSSLGQRQKIRTDPLLSPPPITRHTNVPHSFVQETF